MLRSCTALNTKGINPLVPKSMAGDTEIIDPNNDELVLNGEILSFVERFVDVDGAYLYLIRAHFRTG